MQGQKYPITEMGVLNLVDKLLEVAYKDSKFGECEVTYTEGTTLFRDTPAVARLCTMIQVVHPVPRRNFIFHIARIFVDNELNMPIRYESYDWPRKEGESPTLIEAYTYRELKINVGLTDMDFDHTNPAYAFP
jgi:outer membrane lipoprotein-sorting protein